MTKLSSSKKERHTGKGRIVWEASHEGRHKGRGAFGNGGSRHAPTAPADNANASSDCGHPQPNNDNRQNKQTYSQQQPSAGTAAASGAGGAEAIGAMHVHSVQECRPHYSRLQPPSRLNLHSSVPRTANTFSSPHIHKNNLASSQRSVIAATTATSAAIEDTSLPSSESQLCKPNQLHYRHSSPPPPVQVSPPAAAKGVGLYFNNHHPTQPPTPTLPQVKTQLLQQQTQSQQHPHSAIASSNPHYSLSYTAMHNNNFAHPPSHYSAPPTHYSSRYQSMGSGYQHYHSSVYHSGHSLYTGHAMEHSTSNSELAVPTYLHAGRSPHSTSTSPTVPPGIRPSTGFGTGRPLTAEEKEIKRKVSHSAIEKRRRERTNNVLRELQEIVPGLSKPGKIQKLEILEATADYIRQLTASSIARQRGRGRYQQPFVDKSIQEIHSQQQIRLQPQPQQQQHVFGVQRWQCRPVHGEQVHYEFMNNCHASHNIIIPERASSDEPLNQQRHAAIATPKSVYSQASVDESADDALASQTSSARPLVADSQTPDDPSSMNVNFLLC